MPLHLAAKYNTSKTVVQAVLAAHPDAAKARGNVRGHGHALRPTLHAHAPCPHTRAPRPTLHARAPRMLPFLGTRAPVHACAAPHTPAVHRTGACHFTSPLSPTCQRRWCRRCLLPIQTRRRQGATCAHPALVWRMYAPLTHAPLLIRPPPPVPSVHRTSCACRSTWLPSPIHQRPSCRQCWLLTRTQRRRGTT
jgi:hypothetical protein